MFFAHNGLLCTLTKPQMFPGIFPLLLRLILVGRLVEPLSPSHAPLQLLSGCIPAGAYRVRHRLIFDTGFWPVLKGPSGSRGRSMPRIPVATKHTMTPTEMPAQQRAAARRRDPCFWSSLLGQALLLLCCAPLLVHHPRRSPRPTGLQCRLRNRWCGRECRSEGRCCRNQLPKLILGVKFADGLEVVRSQAQAAAA